MNKVFCLWLLALCTSGCQGEFGQGTIEVSTVDDEGDLYTWEYGTYFPGAILEAKWPLCLACISREDCGFTMNCRDHSYCENSYNYCNSATMGNRSSDDIDTVVIHTLQGYYQAAVDMFQNKSNRISIHYLVDFEGTVGHLLSEYQAAMHSGNIDINKRSIGIEVEGFMQNPQDWYTQSMYQSTAQLVYYLTQKYKIPVDRQHIIGHWEVPDTTRTEWCGGWSHHSDPGAGWDWEYFLQLVQQQDVTWDPNVWFSRPEVKGTLIDLDAPKYLFPGDNATVRFTMRNDGRITWENNQVELFTLPADQKSPLYKYGWKARDWPKLLGQGCYGSMTENTFYFPIHAPSTHEEMIQEEFHIKIRKRGATLVELPDTLDLNINILPCDGNCPLCDHQCNNPSQILCEPEGTNSYRRCEENDRGCRVWGNDGYSCPENKICLQGQCVPYPCLNECADESVTLCLPEGGSTYHTCQRDEHGCLQWSDELFSCPEPMVCQGGFCLPPCENECDEGAILCSPENSVNYRTCVKDERGCLHWSEELSTCAERRICSSSMCVH